MFINNHFLTCKLLFCIIHRVDFKKFVKKNIVHNYCLKIYIILALALIITLLYRIRLDFDFIKNEFKSYELSMSRKVILLGY